MSESAQKWERSYNSKKQTSLTQYLSVSISAIEPELPFIGFKCRVKPKVHMTDRFRGVLESSGLPMASFTEAANAQFDYPPMAMDWQVEAAKGRSHARAKATMHNSCPMESRGHVFFRVVADNPGGIQANAAKSEFDTGDIVVKFLTFLDMDDNTKSFAVVEPSTTECHVISKDSLTAVFSDAQIWTRADTESYTIADLAVLDKTRTQEALTAMRACATMMDAPDMLSFDLPNESEYMAALEELRGFEVVDVYFRTPRVTSWRFTPQGKSRLQLVWTLREPRGLFTPHTNCHLTNMSILDMVHCVIEAGWELHIWSRDMKSVYGSTPPAIRVATKLPKRWWLLPNGNTVSKPYLKCLLQIDRLKNAEYIEHLGTLAYYNDLLRQTKRTDPSPIGNADGLQDLLSLTEEAESDIAPIGLPRVVGKRPRAKKPAEHAKTHAWGGGLLTYKDYVANNPTSKRENAWQATCPLNTTHAKPGHEDDARKTKCTKTLQFSDDAGELITLQRLRHWLNSCQNYGTRHAHMKNKANYSEPRPSFRTTIK